MYTCPHTGVALAALIKLVNNGTIDKKEKTVVISTAHGLKFSEFKVGYNEKSLKDAECRHTNMPVTIEPDADKTKEILEVEFAKRKI